MVAPAVLATTALTAAAGAAATYGVQALTAKAPPTPTAPTLPTLPSTPTPQQQPSSSRPNRTGMQQSFLSGAAAAQLPGAAASGQQGKTLLGS